MYPSVTTSFFFLYTVCYSHRVSCTLFIQDKRSSEVCSTGITLLYIKPYSVTVIPILPAAVVLRWFAPGLIFTWSLCVNSFLGNVQKECRSSVGGGEGRGAAQCRAYARRGDGFWRWTWTTASLLHLLLLPSFSSTRSMPLHTIRVLQHLLDERRHGTGNFHLQCDHSLCSWGMVTRNTGSVLYWNL